jgi:putative monooxygenase
MADAEGFFRASLLCLVAEMTIRKVSAEEVPPNRRRGGTIRVLLSPHTVGATSGFMGVGTLAPAERVTDHYHPYSDEFMYLVSGSLRVTVNGKDVIELAAGDGLMVPRDTPHRLQNGGSAEAFVVFASAPLAPSPELGHVDLEAITGDLEHPAVGGQ